jgi:thiosulfate/3-mercaptopyruvate sulfurtransferase
LVYDSADCDKKEYTGAASMADYAHPEVLVSTEWVAGHLHDPNVRIVESDEDRALYVQGHVPGAVEIDWMTDLQDATCRDYIDKAAFEKLCAERGISNDTTVVFYGDKSNWWACYAFWVFKLYGHKDCRIMNGGRKKWELDGRAWSSDRVSYPRAHYTATEQDGSIRALRDEVLKHCKAGKQLLDVRSPEEYRGERMHMPDYPNEGACRGGHVPGAVNIPWPLNCNDDGTFKSVKELEKLYKKEHGLKQRSPTIAYCRIGERSSLTWFVLTYLLGFGNVKNYDGSWLEWGNAVRVPIAKGAEPGSYATVATTPAHS